MITDNLTHCIFCKSKLKITTPGEDFIFKCLYCPNEENHEPNKIWGYYDDYSIHSVGGDKLTSFNILIDCYQLCFNFQKETTKLLDEHKKIILELSYLLDIKLNKKFLLKKIKTMIVFS